MTTTPDVPPAPVPYGGCPWPIDPACAGAEWAALDPDVQERAVAFASATLQRLTGNRVTNCTITVRPCKPRTGWNTGHALPFYTGYPFLPTITATGAWINVGCCGVSDCHCETTCSVALPRPASRVDEVRVDGVALAPSDYFLSGNLLVWAGEGACPFPATQDLGKPDTEVGTFSVTYLNGYAPDGLAACAAGTLAAEYAKVFTGQGKCRLPAGVTTVVRQGVTMEIASGAFPDGLTGIRNVDAFIAMWNPRGLEREATVWSPDAPKGRVQR